MIKRFLVLLLSTPSLQRGSLAQRKIRHQLRIRSLHSFSEKACTIWFGCRKFSKFFEIIWHKQKRKVSRDRSLTTSLKGIFQEFGAFDIDTNVFVSFGYLAKIFGGHFKALELAETSFDPMLMEQVF